MTSSNMYATITSSGRRGYLCVAHSEGLSKSTIATLERIALPFGSSWQLYMGARSVKAFPIDRGRMAVSYVRITDNYDDHGRLGVLTCQCVVVKFEQFVDLISRPYFAFDAVFNQPGAVSKLLDSRPGGEDSRVHDELSLKISSSSAFRSRLRLLIGRRVILRRPFSNAEQWRSVEHAVQSLVLHLPTALKRNISFVTFTTSSADPMRLIAMPEGRSPEVQGRMLG